MEAGNDFFSFLQRRGFNPDVFVRVVRDRTELSDIYDWKNLEIARFAAKFLLETLPENPIDPETKPFLESIRDGSRIPDGYVAWCRWPQKPEFYRKTLNWPMVGVAEEVEAERRAEDNTHWFMLQTGRGDEYMARKLKQIKPLSPSPHD